MGWQKLVLAYVKVLAFNMEFFFARRAGQDVASDAASVVARSAGALQLLVVRN